MTDRIIVLIDMDCFYVQVEERDNPQIRGCPAAVVQYNSWKGGGIIAVNYEARAYGVKRGMRGEDAKELCPSIHLIQVPVQRGKADLSKYRNAGKEVVSVLCEFSDNVERASVDEAYIDFTQAIKEKMQIAEEAIQPDDLPSTWVIGYDSSGEKETNLNEIDARRNGLDHWLKEIDLGTSEGSREAIFNLSVAARMCEAMRRRVLEVTGFKCSAGISHNKMLGKLACGLHKPNQQSILPMNSVPSLWSEMPIGKVRNLGGKLGDSLTTDLGYKTMGDLSKLPLERLRANYDEKTAYWLFLLGQGIDNEPVTSRQLAKSIGCSKNFNGKEILNTKEKVRTWMSELAEELSERLIEDQDTNERLARTLTVHIKTGTDDKSSAARSCPLPSYKADALAKSALSLIASANTATSKDAEWSPPIRNISLSASKFESLSSRGTAKINDIFKKVETTVSERASVNQNKDQVMEAAETSESKSDGRTNPSFSVRKSLKGKPKRSKSKEKNQKSFFLQFMTSKNKVTENSLSPNLKSDDIDKSENDWADASNNNIDRDDNDLQDLDNSSDSIYNRSTDLDEDVEIIDERSNMRKISKSSSCDHPLRSNNNTVSQERDSNGISIHDLFPDLDNVDAAVVDILPINLQKRIRSAIEAYKKEKQKQQPRRKGDGINGKTKPNAMREDSPEIKPREGNERIRVESEHIEYQQSSDSGSRDNCEDEVELCKECNRRISMGKMQEHRDFHYASELRKSQLRESSSLIVSETKRKQKATKSPFGSRSKKAKSSQTPNIESFFTKKER